MRYYIRQQKKYVSGPHEIEHIRRWIKEGKVRPNMEFSGDEIDWAIGIELPDLFPNALNPARRERTRANRQRRLQRYR